MQRPCWWSALAGLALVGAPRAARALGPEGAPIDTSDYTIDFYQGPVLKSSRINGLAGATAPLTPGVGGYFDNPATAALRVPWSTSFYDWELDASVGSPSFLVDTDLDNNGTIDSSGASLFVTLGAGFQFGPFGVGVAIDVKEHQVQPRGAAPIERELTVSQGRIEVVAAYSLFDGQLALGAGIETVVLDMSFQEEGDSLPVAAVAASALQLGVVWSPMPLPIRAGASVRIPQRTAQGPTDVGPDANGDYVAEGFYFPKQIETPVVLQAALTVQWFRTLNGPWLAPPAFHGPDRTPPPEFTPPKFSGRRGHLRATAGLEVTLPVREGVGIESFLNQVVERSGRSTTLSPRLGIEGEPWTNGLILRGGSYLEPTRFANGAPRAHGTIGADLHIPIAWSVFGLLDEDTTFRIGGALDRAVLYFGWSASLGVWH